MTVDISLLQAFSEEWYLERYHDVNKAVQDGRFRSGLQHYREIGFKENRLPFDIDPQWYLSQYPDARTAVDSDKFESAAHHYARRGRYIGMMPKPNAYSAPIYRMRGRARRVFAIGAYGTNNVGDEAIFEGIRKIHLDAVPIYLAKSNSPGAIFVEKILNQDNPFEQSDYLIVGGGGLFYDKPSSSVLLQVARAARTRGAVVDLLGVGLEGAKEDSFDAIRELASLCDVISVRSSTSQAIFEQICGRKPILQLDFAFELGNYTVTSKDHDSGFLDIGVVTSGDFRENFDHLIKLLNEKLTVDKHLRFHHIPHSKAYLSPQNNDVTVGQIFWSSLRLFREDRELRFITAPFEADPLRLLRRYADLDGVITRRYHGMVFSQIVGIPILAAKCASLKNKSFRLDHETERFFACDTDEELAVQFPQFQEACEEVKKARLRY